jgi:hypothetical protein
VLMRCVPTAMFRLFQAAALHGRTTESSAYVAEARTSSLGARRGSLRRLLKMRARLRAREKTC